MSEFEEAAQAGKCGRCKAPIWKLSTGGFNTRLDTESLSPLLEILARQGGRLTYLARPWAGFSFIADLRPRHLVGTEHPKPHVVLADHSCEFTLTHKHKHPDYWNRKPHGTDNPDLCPF